MVKEMNDFVSRFMSETEERDTILSEAAAVAESHDNPKLVVCYNAFLGHMTEV